MAEIITDRDLRHEIEQLIRHSERFLYIISPYLSFDEDIKMAFKSNPGDLVKAVFYRETSANKMSAGFSDETRSFLKSLPNIELIPVQNLHAKLFITHGIAIISTMNLTQSSNHNHEIGVLIHQEDDPEMYEDCGVYVFEELFKRGNGDVDWERLKNVLPSQPFRIDFYRSKAKINGKIIERKLLESLHQKCNVKHGYCIRCGTTNINFNPLQPLCLSCYSEWRKYNNYDYIENVCHRCANDVETNLDNPLCQYCIEIYETEIKREWEKINTSST